MLLVLFTLTVFMLVLMLEEMYRKGVKKIKNTKNIEMYRKGVKVTLVFRIISVI